DTQLTALAFTEDPELPAIQTPNGQVEFLEMTGITGDELEAMQTWNTLGVLGAAEEHIPYYITDLTRGSLLRIPPVAEKIRQGAEAEGSSTGFLFVDQLAWEPGKSGWFSKQPSVVKMGAKQAGIIAKLLLGRILKGRSLTLVGPDTRVVFDVQLFLDEVWSLISGIYEKESKRIREIKEVSRLQAGIKDYLGVAWSTRKAGDGYGVISIDLDRPFDWSDSSFFDYRFEIVLEMEREEGLSTFTEVLIDEDKLAAQKQELEGFIQSKVLRDLPVRPKELDEFFFARHLLNSDLFEQREAQLEPLIGRLEEKHRSNPDRLLGWVSQYTSAFREWAEERFLVRYFERTGSF
ncbi:hypothetical protein BGX30_007496, partial [Mortierella sp. GBA39]